MTPGDVLSDKLPAAFTWGEYVRRWADDHGGWTQLADALIRRAGGAVEIAQDPQTVERGLRRLAQRAHQSGGQYGRWMLRFFGLLSPVEDLVKWMGQYHTRFSDLPAGLRLEHLTLWNRPPVAESPSACWLLAGIAQVHASRADLAACDQALQRAELLAPRAGSAAEIEIGLLRAQLDTDAGERAAAQDRIAQIEQRIAGGGLHPADDRAYRARIQHLRALHHTRPLPGEHADLHRAHALYLAIDEHPYIPFVSFRKYVGLAYCAWQLGNLTEAVQLAERAVEHAGDGGLVRMRVMALNMLSRTLQGDQASSVNQRARRMATLLEDEDLLDRVARCTPAPAA
jgi:tetratricopeptide (TPR) repeat protein